MNTGSLEPPLLPERAMLPRTAARLQHSGHGQAILLLTLPAVVHYNLPLPPSYNHGLPYRIILTDTPTTRWNATFTGLRVLRFYPTYSIVGYTATFVQRGVARAVSALCGLLFWPSSLHLCLVCCLACMTAAAPRTCTPFLSFAPAMPILKFVAAAPLLAISQLPGRAWSFRP